MSTRITPQASDSNPGTESEPYLTIAGALVGKGPGDEVIVKEGIYREGGPLYPPSWAAGNRFVLRGEPGKRVVISGKEPVTDWTLYAGDIYVTTIDREPERLYVDYDEQILARYPNDGWLQMDSATIEDGVSLTITDTDLIGLSSNMMDGEVYIWTYSGQWVYSVDITGFNSSTGTITTEYQDIPLADGDTY